VQDLAYAFIPNAFTPNGDGLNDFFGPTIRLLKPGSYMMVISNRWGQEIFRTTSLDQPWDGTFKGQDVNTGKYVYTIWFKNSRGTDFKESGTVSLLR
jgi:gliding motility-associated-like protein